MCSDHTITASLSTAPVSHVGIRRGNTRSPQRWLARAVVREYICPLRSPTHECILHDTVLPGGSDINDALEDSLEERHDTLKFLEDNRAIIKRTVRDIMVNDYSRTMQQAAVAVQADTAGPRSPSDTTPPPRDTTRGTSGRGDPDSSAGPGPDDVVRVTHGNLADERTLDSTIHIPEIIR